MIRFIEQEEFEEKEFELVEFGLENSYLVISKIENKIEQEGDTFLITNDFLKSDLLELINEDRDKKIKITKELKDEIKYLIENYSFKR